MFTGIVQGISKVLSITDDINFRTIKLLFPSDLIDNLVISQSVSINGCCLSIIDFNQCEISFNIIKETLKLTNLKNLKENDFVNIERSAKFNDEVGGHFLSGHIIGEATIKSIQKSENNCTMEIEITNRSIMKYIFYKAYIGIDGISFTIGNVYENSFEIHLIPDTINKTTMKYKTEGDSVNIEIDTQTQIIVNTVERVLKEHYSNLPCFCSIKEQVEQVEEE